MDMTDEPTPIGLSEGLAILRRRRRPLLAVFAAVASLTVVAALFWPPTFRSTGTILIEQQEVPDDLVRSTISSYADQRIQIISQRVMTTDNLLGIIRRYDLYPLIRTRKPREVLLERMRQDVQFEMISADVVDPRQGRPTKATIAFSVSYDSRSPEVAARVANELTTLYLDENLKSRRQLTANAAEFLVGEAEKLSARIAELEAQVAAFKQRHVDALPALTGLNLQFMSRSEDELRDVEARIRSLDQQIVYLDAQLAQIDPTSQVYTSTGERILGPADRLKLLRAEYARVSGVYATDHPDVVRVRRELEGLERQVGEVAAGSDLARQLAEAETQLAAARERYAAEHPDVQQLERLVASIQASLASAAPAASSGPTAAADNPAYIQVQAQREASINERTSLARKRAQLRAKIGDYEERLTQSPEIEREYSGLTRELESAQLKYREVRQKQMEAQLAQSLEVERKGERFTLIEPPIPPQEPVSPNRPAILALGLILGIGITFGFVAALEMLDTRVRGRRDLENLLRIPPLAVLPWIETAEERAIRSRRQRYAFAGALVTAVVSAAIVHFLYRPLDVLWLIALRRLGG
jgi:uncharacterized protein involved in exopolysaccharide biosynthesis